jgi:DNA-binding NtrC family response regulator
MSRDVDLVPFDSRSQRSVEPHRGATVAHSVGSGDVNRVERGSELAGDAPELAEAWRVAAVAAGSSLPVLITGERGTGKERLARAIHHASDRRDHPFIAVDCAAISRELAEGELFGYSPGAAPDERYEGIPGIFEAADGGTVFLDEVGELPPSAQGALLRVLAAGESTRVGDAHGRRVDVRVIAATSRDVREAMAYGRMRADLYYRLKAIAIDLPPLRARRADIPRLAQRFLAEAAADLGRSSYGFARKAVEALQAYAWPGNVRELKNLMRRLVTRVPEARITVADLPEPIRREYRHVRDGFASWPPEPTSVVQLPVARTRNEDAERERLARAVAAAPTMAEAARQLGITRRTLYRRLEHHGLHPRRSLHRA